MSRVSKSKTQDSVHSSLLSSQENDRVEELLGRRCASLATVVAQLFMALPHSPSTWSLQQTGVVCFVKDNPLRSYFIRMFDVKAGKQIWEQELYNQITYYCPQQFFHTFAADDCQVGLNFASVQEAECFRQVVEDKINLRVSRGGQDRKQQYMPPIVDRGSLPPLPSGKGPGLPMATVDIQNPDIQPSRYRSLAPPLSLKSKKEKKSKKKAKLSKADIGAPSGFEHVSHVGWDPNNLDPDLKKLLSSAGISEAELKDEETSQLIQNFIEQSGGLDAVKKEMNRAGAPPPPPPGRHGPLPSVPINHSAPPVPPPSRSRSGPLPPVPGMSSQGPPPPSQPSHGRGGLPPPPPASRGGFPPPPPPSSHAPPPPPPSAAHQRSMAGPPPPAPSSAPNRGGGGPAPPPPPPPPPPPAFPPPPCGSPPPPATGGRGGGGGGGEEGGRGALLDQIRLGRKLKNVTENPDTPPSPQQEENEGIVGALMMVMQKRSKVIHSSDEGEDDGGDDEDDDDEWD